jgi:hypothetical protein
MVLLLRLKMEYICLNVVTIVTSMLFVLLTELIAIGLLFSENVSKSVQIPRGILQTLVLFVLPVNVSILIIVLGVNILRLSLMLHLDYLLQCPLVVVYIDLLPTNVLLIAPQEDLWVVW